MHPAPVVTHPFWKAAQAALVFVVVGASAQSLAEQAAAVVPVPLQLKSDPTYEAHVVEVPVYDEQAPSTLVQPYPVVTHPAKNCTQAAVVVVEAGASEQAKALQAVDPAAVLEVHAPSDPIKPVHPYD